MEGARLGSTGVGRVVVGEVGGGVGGCIRCEVRGA